MIKSFASKETEKVWRRQYAKKLPENIQKRARDKLLGVDNAQGVRDLRNPPGNHLEKRSGDRAGQWSVRISQQWRLCFDWREDNAYNVKS